MLFDLLLLAAPSMSHFLNQTSKAVLDKYKGDLDNLRKEAKYNPARERELVKEFKVHLARQSKTTYTPQPLSSHMFLCTVLGTCA